MRLIDADKLLERASKYHIFDYVTIKGLVDSEPTAFDVDNAVKQLETGLEEILYDRCYSNDYDMGMKEVNALLDKVMKGAVKDD